VFFSIFVRLERGIAVKRALRLFKCAESQYSTEGHLKQRKGEALS